MEQESNTAHSFTTKEEIDAMFLAVKKTLRDPSKSDQEKWEAQKRLTSAMSKNLFNFLVDPDCDEAERNRRQDSFRQEVRTILAYTGEDGQNNTPEVK